MSNEMQHCPPFQPKLQTVVLAITALHAILHWSHHCPSHAIFKHLFPVRRPCP
jgi:hypothetical protein